MSGKMWERLGGLREAVKEGLQEFSRDALKETSLLKETVVENVAPVTNVLGNAPILGRRKKKDKVEKPKLVSKLITPLLDESKGGTLPVDPPEAQSEPPEVDHHASKKITNIGSSSRQSKERNRRQKVLSTGVGADSSKLKEGTLDSSGDFRPGAERSLSDERASEIVPVTSSPHLEGDVNNPSKPSELEVESTGVTELKASEKEQVGSGFIPEELPPEPLADPADASQTRDALPASGEDSHREEHRVPVEELRDGNVDEVAMAPPSVDQLEGDIPEGESAQSQRGVPVDVEESTSGERERRGTQMVVIGTEDTKHTGGGASEQVQEREQAQEQVHEQEHEREPVQLQEQEQEQEQVQVQEQKQEQGGELEQEEGQEERSADPAQAGAEESSEAMAAEEGPANCAADEASDPTSQSGTEPSVGPSVRPSLGSSLEEQEGGQLSPAGSSPGLDGKAGHKAVGTAVEATGATEETEESPGKRRQEEGERERRKMESSAEVERLNGLCQQLRSSLDEALNGRASLLRQLGGMEDELESIRAQAMRHELEADRWQSAAGESDKRAEEQLQAARRDHKVLKDKLQVAERELASKEFAIAAAKKEREGTEQKHKAAVASMEKIVEGLNGQLQEREKDLEEVAEENEKVVRDFNEQLEALEASMAERDSLRESLTQQEQELQECRASLSKAEAEAKAARREAAESSVELADAKAEIWAVREAAKGKALGEDERQQLEAALKAVSTSSQVAAAEASEWRDKCQQAEEQEKVRGRQLAALEAELALAHHRLQEAEANADEAQRLRAQAEGTSEQLREQTERRARIFNAAVKAAVSKIQSELEEERDAAIERIAALESDAAAHSQELAKSQKELRLLTEDLEAANSRGSAALEEQDELRRQVAALEKHLAKAEEREREAAKSAQAARDATSAALREVKEVGAQCQELQLAAAAARQELLSQEALHLAGCERLKEMIAAAEREKSSLQVAAVEASARSADDAASMRTQLANLEGQLASSEKRLQQLSETKRSIGSSSSAAAPPPPLPLSSGPVGRHLSRKDGSALAELGLDALGRIGSSASAASAGGDVEAGSGAELSTEARRRSGGKLREDSKAASWLKRSPFEDHERIAGRISRRSFLVGLYIMLLHIMVMVSFTRDSHPAACDPVSSSLSGLPAL
eukprot:jgi/Mesen1/10951/ME000096S10527